MTQYNLPNRKLTMTPGVVVRLRINPTTCISVLDTLQAVGVDTSTKTFASCVSAALNILVANAIQSGVLPEPDPFQFANRMRHHKGSEAPDRRRLPKGNLGQLDPLIFPKHKLPSLPKIVPEPAAIDPGFVPPQNEAEVAALAKWDVTPKDPEKLMEYRAAQQRLTTAQIKKDSVEDGHPGIIWSAEDERNYQRDMKIVFEGLD